VIKLPLGRSEERVVISIQPREVETEAGRGEREKVPGSIAVDKETFGPGITETSRECSRIPLRRP